jgi:hypothetical protein
MLNICKFPLVLVCLSTVRMAHLFIDGQLGECGATPFLYP